jgi:hypothetical protein
MPKSKKAETKSETSVSLARISYVSSDLGALVELLQQDTAEKELFVSKDILAKIKGGSALNKGRLVQIERMGSEVSKIEPFA